MLLKEDVESALKSISRPGILLSGGVDSSLLAVLATEYNPDIPCFVVGGSKMNPDVQAAKQLAEEKELKLHTNILDLEQTIAIKQELRKSIPLNIYEGDECVFAALKFAVSEGITGIIATDGIDELMGGYWGHRDRIRFPNIKDAFDYYKGQLEEKHLSPMRRSAEFHKLKIIFIFRYHRIVELLSMIPLEDRIKGNVGKVVWKEIAQMAGVPSWIIEREKRGFVHAFN